MNVGNYVLVLHTHLPYVLHHGNWPHGSDWLCEAVAECYIPLLNSFHELLAEGIPPKVTIDISPILCEQLAHKDFPALFEQYCTNKIRLAAEDEKYFRRHQAVPHNIYLAQFWQQWYSSRKQEFVDKYDRSIINALKTLQDRNAIEIITCGATHGYLPLLGDDRSVSLQMKAAVENYKKHFGKSPRGAWIPECAYRPSYAWQTYVPVPTFSELHPRLGVEEVLADNGIEFFFIDQQPTNNAKPLGAIQSGMFVPTWSKDFVVRKNSFDRTPLSLFNVQSEQKVPTEKSSIAFTRHQKVAMQVWSGDSGYPGDPTYLDFHKKHFSSALRYWRVTDNKADMMYKMLYVPDWISEKIDVHAFHFIKSIESTLIGYRSQSGKFGTLCTPFDTELFGHWWFEGPQFVKAVLRGLHHSPYVNSVTASEQIDYVKPREVMAIPESSWGRGGHHEVWIGDDTKWTWEVIYKDELRFAELLRKFPVDIMPENIRRILTQALRELMLLQASDWQFLISTFSAKDYAEQRFSYHHSDFNLLCSMAERCEGNKKRIKQPDLKILKEIEERNAVFPELKLEWWKVQG
jgi:1,4-alpha-glucan branching enzyme